ncbi:hypothetical protein Ancab_015525, partial [Ancistrocladus abbreviatus]
KCAVWVALRRLRGPNGEGWCALCDFAFGDLTKQSSVDETQHGDWKIAKYENESKRQLIISGPNSMGDRAHLQ